MPSNFVEDFSGVTFEEDHEEPEFWKLNEPTRLDENHVVDDFPENVLIKFEEDEHPRDSLGRFEGEGGAVAAVAEKPAIEPGNKKGPMNNVGGSYRRVRQNSKPGEEIHHMPADTASNLHPSNGPAIAMPKEDHFKTASYGTSSAAQQYRAEQRKLIIAGKFEEAQQMDIDDLRAKFGNKYDAHIKEMRNYTSTLKSRKGSNMLLNPTPKVIRAGGA